MYVRPARYPGLRLTPRRLANFYLVRLQRLLGQTRLVGYPLVLTIEAANVCNLRCPYCFTGAGATTRNLRFFPLPLYERLLRELGDHLLEVEFHNWGEPLLNRRLCRLIQSASGRGISTIVSTNFSLPFDGSRAEALVSSGLAILGVSIDGASQETYEQYRVGGDFRTVIDNVRLVKEAKERIGSISPRLIWSYHVFEHNLHEIEPARTLALELGMEFSASKGWVAGAERVSDGECKFFKDPTADRCEMLWERAVVQADGGVSPCDGAFFREDDFGSVTHMRFREVWNNREFRQARSLFRSGRFCGDGANLVCHDCPETLTHQDYVKHLARGGNRTPFKPRFTANDGFNHFFSRRPPADPA